MRYIRVGDPGGFQRSDQVYFWRWDTGISWRIWSGSTRIRCRLCYFFHGTSILLKYHGRIRLILEGRLRKHILFYPDNIYILLTFIFKESSEGWILLGRIRGYFNGRMRFFLTTGSGRTPTGSESLLCMWRRQPWYTGCKLNSPHKKYSPEKYNSLSMKSWPISCSNLHKITYIKWFKTSCT